MAQEFILGTTIASSNLDSVPESVTPGLFEIALIDDPLLALLGMENPPVTNVVHSYNERQWAVASTTLNGALASGDTTFVLAEAVFVAGEEIVMGSELVLLGTTNDNLTFSTCTRAVGTYPAATTTGTAACATGARVYSTGKKQAQGASASSGDLVVQPNTVTTYCRIYSFDITVTDTANALDEYWRPGVGKYDQIRADGMKLLVKEFGNDIIFGGPAVAASTTATAGKYDGIVKRIYSTASGSLSWVNPTLDNLRTGVRGCKTYGGMPDTLVINDFVADIIDGMGLAHVAVPDYMNEMFGTRVRRVRVGGADLDLVTRSDLGSNMLLLTRGMIKPRPLVGRSFFEYKLGKTGSSTKGRIEGEYTLEVPCPRAHYHWYACPTS